MNHNSVGWFEIYVQDIARAKAFYEGVFQQQLEQLGSEEIDAELEMWGFPMNMEGTGTSGALVKMSGFPSAGNSTLVYFNCEDCAVEEARVEACGGRIQKPKMSIGQYGFITLAFDTEGNLIGLHSMK
jgi:uncharacterized protein